jgi:hypothetical protein
LKTIGEVIDISSLQLSMVVRKLKDGAVTVSPAAIGRAVEVASFVQDKASVGALTVG